MRQSETFFYDYKCRKTSKQPTSLRLKIFAWIPYKIDILCSVPDVQISLYAIRRNGPRHRAKIEHAGHDSCRFYCSCPKREEFPLIPRLHCQYLDEKRRRPIWGRLCRTETRRNGRPAFAGLPWYEQEPSYTCGTDPR